MLKTRPELKYFYLIGIIISLIVIFVFFHKKEFSTDLTNDPFTLESIPPFDFSINTCPINNYGAVGDGKTLNTSSFQKAIEECAKKGGGRVIIPAGNWLTGAINLQSNIELHLENNSRIIFSSNPSDYLPVVFTRLEGIELYNFSSLIYAKDAENIKITGNGTLDGNGQDWMSWKNGEKKGLKKLSNFARENVPPEQRIFGYTESGLRPSFIQLVRCKNITLTDFLITNSPRWTIHPIYSEQIVMQNLRVETDGFNTDGIIIDSSKNVLIENSTLKTGDDTIAIKSGLDQDGWRVNIPSENIIIRNSTILGGHSAIAIGSEMSGNIKNVYLQNLKFDGIDQGIRVKSLAGRGGIVENIWAKNIQIGSATNVAVKFDLTYDASTIKPNTKKIPTFRNFYIENLSVSDTNLAIQLDGLTDSKISNVHFKNIIATAREGADIKNSKNIDFENIDFSKIEKQPVFKIENSSNIGY